MNEEAYERLISGPGVLDHTTLNLTLKELSFKKETALVAEIKRILQNNRIEKPLPSAPGRSPDYYRIDLPAEDIRTIIDLFFDLEEEHLAADGSNTPVSSFYSSVADKWSPLA